MTPTMQPPAQTQTAMPEMSLKETPYPAGGKRVTIRYSHYWPPLGGVNTSVPGAPHLARCANGDRWQDWAGRGLACPPEWAFGTKVRAFGKVWTCVDRGGMVKYVDGVPWVDFLEPEARLPYGTLVEVEIIGRGG